MLSTVKASSTVASSEGDEDDMDIDSDKEGEEGSTKSGKLIIIFLLIFPVKMWWK